MGGLLVQAVVGMFIHGGKAVAAEGVNMEFAGDIMRRQSAGVEQNCRS